MITWPNRSLAQHEKNSFGHCRSIQYGGMPASAACIANGEDVERTVNEMQTALETHAGHTQTSALQASILGPFTFYFLACVGSWMLNQSVAHRIYCRQLPTGFSLYEIRKRYVDSKGRSRRLQILAVPDDSLIFVFKLIWHVRL